MTPASLKIGYSLLAVGYSSFFRRADGSSRDKLGVGEGLTNVVFVLADVGHSAHDAADHRFAVPADMGDGWPAPVEMGRVIGADQRHVRGWCFGSDEFKEKLSDKLGATATSTLNDVRNGGPYNGGTPHSNFPNDGS